MVLAALKDWWKDCKTTEPFKVEAFNLPSFRSLSSLSATWVINICHHSTSKIT